MKIMRKDNNGHLWIENRKEYLKLKKKIDAREAAIDALLCDGGPIRKRNFITADESAKLPHAKQFAGEQGNKLRSALEEYEFFHCLSGPKYSVHIREKSYEAITWTGQRLGAVSFGSEFRSNMGDVRINITLRSDNGQVWFGTFFKGAGEYANIRLSKKHRLMDSGAEKVRAYGLVGLEKA